MPPAADFQSADGQGGAVVLPIAIARSLWGHLQACYPNEGCGLLTGWLEGHVWRVTGFHPAANVHAEPRRHFELDPAAHFALLRHLRDNGQAGVRQTCIIGHVHSHPDGPARPSSTDLAMAHDPSLLWLIAAVTADATQTPPDPARLTGWALNRATGTLSGFMPVPVRLV